MPIINTEEPEIAQTMVYPEMLQAFEGHLAKEFSSENIAFLRALHDLQIKASNPSITDDALRQQTAGIYDRYVKVGSDRQVNLPSDQVKAVELQLENLATMNRQQMVDTFTDPTSEVNRLISKDSFPRFVRSKEFTEAAKKVESNLNVEDQIADLREQAEHARLNPSVGDRMKSTVGAKTKAQELTERADTLQREVDASRALQPLDVPQVDMQSVNTSVSQLAGQHRDFAAKQAAEFEAMAQARALQEGPKPDEDKDIAVDKQEELEEHEWEQQPDDLDELQEHEWEQPAPELGQEESQAPKVQVGGDDDWPELEEQEVMQRGQSESVSEMEVGEMSVEELAAMDLGQGRGRGQNVDEIGVGQTRGRAQGQDSMDLGQTRGRSRGMPEPPEPPKPSVSVRDSLGRRDSQPKQGQGGPKVH